MSDLRARAAEAAGAADRTLKVMQATAERPEEAAAPLPDVDNSNVPAAMDVPVHIAWSRCMADVQWIGKERNARDYKYRGIDDVVNVVAPIIRKHGVSVIPIGATPSYTVINTSKGAAMNYCRLVSRFQVFGPQGDSFIGETPGEAFDNGDKSSTKAQSVALRTFYIQALCIPVNRPELDTEYGVQHEIAGPRARTAEEYAADIVAESTSVPKLQQIKAELIDNPTMGKTEVDLFGQPERLIDLVNRIGRERQAKR